MSESLFLDFFVYIQVLRLLHMVTHLILVITVRGTCCHYPHLRSEETEAEGVEVTCTPRKRSAGCAARVPDPS